MGLLDFFRRKPPIRSPDELATFIDENAAFLVQKGIYEYARARAGHYAKVLFAEQGFQRAVEASRWRAFPLGLAIMAEMVEGELQPHAAGERQGILAALSALVLAAFDRYPVPDALGASAWAEAREELARRVALLGLHPRKPVKDIPTPFAEAYFALMPVHEKLRGQDFPTIRNYLRVALCNIRDELDRRMDGARMVRTLLGRRGDEPPPG